MPLLHYRWEPNGRTYRQTDDQGNPTDRFVYQSAIGQQNTPDGSGGFLPFLMSAGQIRYGHDDLSVGFDDDKQVLRKAANVLCSSFKLFVQARIAGQWVNQPHGAPSRSMRSGEVFRDGGWVENENKSTGFLSFPDAALSFGSQDPYQLYVGIEAGGSSKASIGFRFRAPATGRMRFQIVLDGLHKLPNDWEWINNTTLFGAESRRLGIKVKDLIWRWTYDEAPYRDIVAEDNPDGTKKISIIIGPFDYTANTWLTVYPDTWGATETSDDCLEVAGGYYDDNGSGDLVVGELGSYGAGIAADAGMKWTNVTVPAGSTAEDGCHLDLSGVGNAGSGTRDADLRIVDSRNPSDWSSGNLPTDQSLHAAAVAWDADLSGPTAQSPEIKTLIQARLDDDHQSGDGIAIVWLNNITGSALTNGNYWDAEEAGTGTQLTIAYTPAAGGADLLPFIMQYGQFNGGLL